MSSKLKELPSHSRLGATSSRGILFVVSSPSGGGKGTLIRRVLDVVPNLSYSVSYTTRAPRNGEVNGREYFFVNRQKFEEMIKADEFLEWACVHGNLYGTSRRQLAEETADGLDIILEVDVQGAESVRKLELDSVSIFILPPSYDILRQRLIARGTDTAEELEVRLRNAPKEISHYTDFEYVIINDDMHTSAAQLAAIVHAERASCHRQEGVVKQVIQQFETGSD
jgi:guanylate kinase